MSRTVAASLCLLLSVGCDPPTGAVISTEEATPLPPIKIDLPPPPSFAAVNLPKSYPDGTVSVFGLRKQRNTYLSKDVKVKAYIVEIYQCPPCPKGQTCKSCNQGHFFVSDTPNGSVEQALIVVDYLTPRQVPPKLTVGKQYDIEGTFAINSPTGFSHSDGLLVFNRLTDDAGQVFIGRAAQMEAKALRQAGMPAPPEMAKLPKRPGGGGSAVPPKRPAVGGKKDPGAKLSPEDL